MAIDVWGSFERIVIDNAIRHYQNTQKVITVSLHSIEIISNYQELSKDRGALAGARATAEAIDREVANGRELTEVLKAYEGGQRFWMELARPFSKSLPLN